MTSPNIQARACSEMKRYTSGINSCEEAQPIRGNGLRRDMLRREVDICNISKSSIWVKSNLPLTTVPSGSEISPLHKSAILECEECTDVQVVRCPPMTRLRFLTYARTRDDHLAYSACSPHFKLRNNRTQFPTEACIISRRFMRFGDRNQEQRCQRFKSPTIVLVLPMSQTPHLNPTLPPKLVQPNP